jgi:DNA polymerase-1
VQFPLIEEATRALNIPYVGIRGIEADDLIATYAKQAREEGHRVTIVTPDKDMLQLALNGHVRVYDPQREVYSDRNTVILKHGISPEQFPELQALIGDTVDNSSYIV